MTNSVLNPERYHGENSQPPFFEGWYYKQVSTDLSHSLAIIPGIYKAKNQENSHCFIQTFHSEENAVNFHRYPIDMFKASPKSFEITIGKNYFSTQKLVLNINDELEQISGSLQFNHLHPWPVKVYSPGAMGWFAWFPFMECYHGVVSMDHDVQGVINRNSERIDFTGGKGYIEKDWGKQFPEAWIWGQSNHFESPESSIMISIAVVPWLGLTFPGFIIGFLHAGKLHRFSTYNGSRIETLRLQDNEVFLIVKNFSHRLSIRANRASGGLLQAPTLIEMDRRISESLDANLHVILEDHRREEIFNEIGVHSGLEIVGDLERLANMVK